MDNKVRGTMTVFANWYNHYKLLIYHSNEHQNAVFCMQNFSGVTRTSMVGEATHPCTHPGMAFDHSRGTLHLQLRSPSPSQPLLLLLHLHPSTSKILNKCLYKPITA